MEDNIKMAYIALGILGLLLIGHGAMTFIRKYRK